MDLSFQPTQPIIGQQLEVKCELANPDPSIDFFGYRFKRTGSTQSEYKLLDFPNSLVIENFSQDNIGTYSCEARDAKGKTPYFMLTPKSVPLPGLLLNYPSSTIKEGQRNQRIITFIF